MIPEAPARFPRRSLAGLSACVILAAFAAPAAGQGASDSEFTESVVEQAGDTYTLVSRKGGRSCRLIAASDLRGLTVGKAQLADLPVCVEGKFDRPITATVFRLMGSDRQFVVKDTMQIVGLMSGDNLWIKGVATLMPGGEACFLAVEEIVTLKGDVDLFNERCARYARARNWQKLLDLGRWIETSGKLIESTMVVDHDLYSSLRDRAYLQALRVFEKELADDDVDGRFKVARMYRELLGRAGDLKAVEHLRRVMELDPGHQQASEALRAMGYVVHKGRWMTRAELAEVLRREQAERDAALAAENRGGTTTGAGSDKAVPERLATARRMHRLAEVDREARSGGDAILALATGIRDEDAPVARRIVWILANTGGDVGLEGLLNGLKSGSADVRKDIADALAWCGCVPDLSAMISGEGEAEVRSHAVSALGSVRTRESVGALVDLLEIDDVGTRARIGEALARATGQTISNPEAWRNWWERNRDSFEPPEATP